MIRKLHKLSLALSVSLLVTTWQPFRVFAVENLSTNSSVQTQGSSLYSDEDDNLSAGSASSGSAASSSASSGSTASSSASSGSTSSSASGSVSTSSGSYSSSAAGTASTGTGSVSSSLSSASSQRMGFYASSKEAGKLKCANGTEIETGQQITVKFNKKAASYDWTWTFEGTAGNDVHIISDDYKSSRQIRFTVWPAAGTVILTGRESGGLSISYGFNVSQTGKWAKREAFRTQALKGVNSSMSEEEMVVYFSDYIADRASYGPGQGNFFRVIDEGVGDCWCYSTAFRLLADAVGIETIIVKNSGSKSHYWNQVQIDGTWYNVDVQGYDTNRSHKWLLSSDAKHGWYGHSTWNEKHSIYYPVEPAHSCSQSIDF